MNEPAFVSRRKEERYPAAFIVRAVGDVMIEGRAMDISTLGCAVEADCAAPARAYLKLELSLPDGEPPLEIPLAVVRWSHHRLFGVEFIAFGESQKTRLRRFVASTSQAEPRTA